MQIHLMKKMESAGELVVFNNMEKLRLRFMLKDS